MRFAPPLLVAALLPFGPAAADPWPGIVQRAYLKASNAEFLRIER